MKLIPHALWLLAIPSVYADAVVFTAPRENPIRRVDSLKPEWKSQAGKPLKFAGEAQPGEYYVFQIGISEDAQLPINMKNTPLKGAGEAAMHCINTTGIDQDGKPFNRKIETIPGKLTPLYMAVDIPQNAKGVYKGKVGVQVGKQRAKTIDVEIKVSGEPLKDHGVSKGKDWNRLIWLDSQAGQEDSVLPPYSAVKVDGRNVNFLGRTITIDDKGMIAQVVSKFSPSNTKIQSEGRNYLTEPVSFNVETNQGGTWSWKSSPVKVNAAGTLATWTANGQCGSLACELKGQVDYTGSGAIDIVLKAGQSVSVKNTTLDMNIEPKAAKYTVGLSNKGGFLKDNVEWKWNVQKQGRDSVWIGDVNIGMAVRLKDENYHRKLVNVYYKFWPLVEPSWANGGKGGWNITKGSSSVKSEAYTGSYNLSSGETKTYKIEFYVTPFHTLNTDMQWATRFFHHSGGKNQEEMDQLLDVLKPEGPNIYNLHHAGFPMPYLNYPMADENIAHLKEWASKVHAKDAAARVYYTTRELTANMPEILALHGLNGELILPSYGNDPKGELNQTTPQWLAENLGEEFIAAWSSDLPAVYDRKDPTVLTVPDSRMDNFYLGGLEWLAKNVGIDGVYLDDTALNARSMQRLRRILMEAKAKGPFVDFHTWDSNHGWGGDSPNMLQYMDLIPYIDRFWLGEGYNPNGQSADEWLVIASGIPFGVMSEMLEGPNHWKGMVFGEVGRMRNVDKRPAIWDTWDKYGLSGTEMIFYSDPKNPVKTGDDLLLATVYKKPGRTFIALGNWNTTRTRVKLDIDWKALGLNPAKAMLYAPEIPGVQKEQAWKPGDEMSVAPGRGYFLVVDEEAREVKASADAALSSQLKTVMKDDFKAAVINQQWIVSDQGQKGTLKQTPGQVTLTGYANCYNGMSYALPVGVRALQATVNIGTDQGQDWGIGIALVWSDKKTVAHLNCRGGDKKYGVYTPDLFDQVETFSPQEDQTIRILLTQDEVLFQVMEDEEWKTVAQAERTGAMEGDPVEMRIGKMSRQGEWKNYSDSGDAGTCSIKEVIVQE